MKDVDATTEENVPLVKSIAARRITDNKLIDTRFVNML